MSTFQPLRSISESVELNGVYAVQSIPSHKTVVVDYTNTISFLPTKKKEKWLILSSEVKKSTMNVIYEK